MDRDIVGLNLSKGYIYRIPAQYSRLIGQMGNHWFEVYQVELREGRSFFEHLKRCTFLWYFVKKKIIIDSMRNKLVIFLSILALVFAILCPSICALIQKAPDSTHSCCTSQKQTTHHQDCSEGCNLHREKLKVNQHSLPQVDFCSIVLFYLPKLDIRSTSIWNYYRLTSAYPRKQLAWLKTIRIRC